KPLSNTFPSDFVQYVNPSLPEDSVSDLVSKLYHHKGAKAINHLFEVSASIDSMVVGEREILRQVREAYQQSLAWNLTGDNLRIAMQQVVQAAKEVYAQTKIGEKPVSVVSLAIQELLKAKVSRDARVLMVGAGQTNNLVGKFLVKHGFSNVTVYNRSLDRALELAGKFDGEGLPLTLLPEHKSGFDCLIVCTGATTAIIQPELYRQLLAGETDRKLVIDLAIPNNVAKEVVAQFDFQYIEIEGLRHLADQNIDFRLNEVDKAREILELHLQQFAKAFEERRIELAMRNVPVEIKAVKAHAMNKVFKKDIESLDDDTRDLLERMMDYMERQCISIPMRAAKGVGMKRKV
ncbi:MAG: glutamyl-tRNA reductase, partial [Bacteroidota bacterium]